MRQITIKRMTVGTGENIVIVAGNNTLELTTLEFIGLKNIIHTPRSKLGIITPSEIVTGEITISEAAKLYGVSNTTIRRWIHNGRLTVVENTSPTKIYTRKDIA